MEVADLGTQVLPVADVDKPREQKPILIVQLVIFLYRNQPLVTLPFFKNS